MKKHEIKGNDKVISIENNSNNPIEKKVKRPKSERIRKEKENLLNKLAANNMKEIRTRVAFILNHFPETRNSDILLQFRYWKVFQPEVLGAGETVDLTKMFRLERATSIIRARAKIQNEYGLFQADEEIKSMRKSKEIKEKEEQLADKPGLPSLSFYLDESSKNQKYIIVGGLCCADSFQLFQLTTHLLKWKLQKKINYEFHFSELTKNKLQAYEDFFKEALSMSSSISFKAVCFKQSGFKGSVDQLICDLFYQLIHKGIEHEVNTKRVSLPRMVNVYKDKDEGDGLLITKLEQELRTGFKKHFDGKLSLNLLEPVDSKHNLLIQLSDLFIGSISRILNEKSPSFNHKDDYASFVNSLLNLNFDSDESPSSQDVATIFIF